MLRNNQDAYLLALRRLDSSAARPGCFHRWVQALPPAWRKSCLSQASRLLETNAPIFEDGEVLLAVAVVANDDGQAFSKLSDRWKERCEKLAPPEA